MKKLAHFLLPAVVGLLLHGYANAQPNPNADPGLTDVTTVPSALLGPNSQAVTTINYSNIGSDPIPVGAVKISLSLNQYLHYVSPLVITGFTVTFSDAENVVLTNSAVIPAFSFGAVSVRTIAVQTTGTTGVPGVYQQKPYTANISRTSPIQAGNTNAGNDNVDANIRVGEVVQAPLPVSLLAFSAKAAGCGAQVQWKATGEDDLHHYEIEQSSDGVTFGFLQTVTGKGGLSNDYSVQTGAVGKKVYYRLVTVQKDGSRKYSAVVAVQVDCGAAPVFNVYPNPVKKGEAISLQSSLASLVSFIVSDAAGKVVAAGKFTGRTAVTKPLASGSYVVELSGDGETKRVKIIVQ